MSVLVSKANTVRILRSVSSGTTTQNELWRIYKHLNIRHHLSALVFHKQLKVISTQYSGNTPINKTFELDEKGIRKLKFYTDIADSSLEYATFLSDWISITCSDRKTMPYDGEI